MSGDIEHEDTVFNLSDVVNDDTIDDEPHHDSSVFKAGPLSFEHPSQEPLVNRHASSHTPSSTPSYSVDVLARELEIFISQGTSDALNALHNASSRQQEHEVRTNSDDAVEDIESSVGMFNLYLQAAERDRLSWEAERQRTKAVPSFHSLTAKSPTSPDQNPRKRQRRVSSSGSDYLYSGASDGERALSPTSIEHDAPFMSSDTSPQLPSEFSDMQDILYQLNAHLGPQPYPDSTDISPIVSHSEAILQNSGPPPTALAPSNRRRLAIPSASTSRNQNPTKRRRIAEYVCGIDGCTKNFSRQSDRTRHTRIHTGYRPFVCEHDGCGRTFIQRSALLVHERVHTGERPYLCEEPNCCKTFGDSSSLARHRRTHTGKRPYVCEEPSCNKSFTRKTTLNEHILTHAPGYVRKGHKNSRREVVHAPPPEEGTPEPDPEPEEEEEELDELDDGDDDLTESVRTLFCETTGTPTPNLDVTTGTLESRVMNIRAEISAAIAQAQASFTRTRHDAEEDEYYEEEDGALINTVNQYGFLGPNTSGIRGLPDGDASPGRNQSTVSKDKETHQH